MLREENSISFLAAGLDQITLSQALCRGEDGILHGIERINVNYKLKEEGEIGRGQGEICWPAQKCQFVTNWMTLF